MPVAQQALCIRALSRTQRPRPRRARCIARTCSGNGSKNDVYGPGLIDFDLSAVKDTQIGERVKVEFRAEMFNVFNRANFNPPLVNNVVFNQDGSHERYLRWIPLQPPADRCNSR